jgi:hypothetical protein
MNWCVVPFKQRNAFVRIFCDILKRLIKIYNFWNGKINECAIFPTQLINGSKFRLSDI